MSGRKPAAGTFSFNKASDTYLVFVISSMARSQRRTKRTSQAEYLACISWQIAATSSEKPDIVT